MGKHTAKDVAQWMVEELTRLGQLYQQTVVYDIASKFGDEFTYHNNNGNLAIDAKVLAEFRKLTGDKVVWSKSYRFWRLRESSDQPGRKQY